MNALARMTEGHVMHAQFSGPIVMIGFGSIGRGVLPLLERHIGFDRSKKPNFSIKAMQIAEEKQAVAQYGSSDSGASLGDILGAALKEAQSAKETKAGAKAEKPAKAVETETVETEADQAEGDTGFGPDSHAALEDGSAPAGFDVKGNKDSMKYHTEGSQWYDATVAEVWFRTAEAAEAAGFEPAGGAAAQGADAGADLGTAKSED